VHRLLEVIEAEDRPRLRGIALAATASAASSLRRHGFEPAVMVADDSAGALPQELAVVLDREQYALAR